jgi:Tol biopolymer transport system component
LPVLSPDGGTLALLIVDRSQSGPVTRVAFSSPDGKQIAYVRQDLNGVSEPVKLQLGTGDKPERIASEPCTPSWSPAGDWILCSGRTAKLISPDGSRVRELSGIFGITAWSNDGKRIYNVRRAEDRVVIEQLDPNTDKRETLTEYALDGPYPIRRFSVSADGKSIGFMAQAGDGDIWILDGFQPPRSLWERLWRRKP